MDEKIFDKKMILTLIGQKKFWIKNSQKNKENRNIIESFLKSIQNHLKPILRRKYGFRKLFHCEVSRDSITFGEYFDTDKLQLRKHVPKLRASSAVFTLHVDACSLFCFLVI